MTDLKQVIVGLAELQSTMLITDSNRVKVIAALNAIKELQAQNAKLQRERDDLQECFDTCYDELTATRDANDELEKEVAELREMIKSFMATNEDLNEWRFEMESTISELLAKGESNG